MATIRLTGHIDENGRIEIAERVDLPPGDVMVVIETVSAEDEAAANAAWNDFFARSQDMLTRMAAKVRKNRDEGLNQELDPETL